MAARKPTATRRPSTTRPTVTVPGIPKVSVQRTTFKAGPKLGALAVGIIWWWNTHPEQTAPITTALTAAVKSWAASQGGTA